MFLRNVIYLGKNVMGFLRDTDLIENCVQRVWQHQYLRNGKTLRKIIELNPESGTSFVRAYVYHIRSS